MDHHLLQRSLIRLLYDPAYRETLARDPAALALPPDVLRALSSVDPRALRADPQLRRRTLRALMEEFRVASTLAVSSLRSVSALEAFFSSPEFHRSLDERSPIALAFGDYLARLPTRDDLARDPLAGHIAEAAQLERLQARSRREAAPVSIGDGDTAAISVDALARDPSVRAAPGVFYRPCAGDALDTVSRVEQFLVEHGPSPELVPTDGAHRLALPARSTDLPSLPLLPLLIVPTFPAGASPDPARDATPTIAVVTLDDELHALFSALDGGAATPSMLSARSGLSRARVDALVAELLDDEVLVLA